MKQAYIYLLLLKNREKFKIGKALNPYQRIQTLVEDNNEFDLQNSYQICGNTYFISKFEYMLHFLFSDYNVNHNVAFEGYTEWFKIECLQRVLELLYKIRDLTIDKVNINKGIFNIEDTHQKNKNKKSSNSQTKSKKIGNMSLKDKRESNLMWDKSIKMFQSNNIEEREEADRSLSKWIYLNFYK